MSTRIHPERARHTLARALHDKTLNRWQVIRIFAVLAFLAFLAAQPDHAVAKALLSFGQNALRVLFHIG